MSNLISAGQARIMPADIVLVIAPNLSSPALEKAASMGVCTEVADPTSPDYACELLGMLKRYEVGWICLAGFLRLLPEPVLNQFPRRILNIHPALLPQYGGKGMYGVRVHEAVLNAGESESGCTVHFVSSEYDAGERILQLRCPVLAGDTPEMLASRVLALEHQAYPQALALAISHDRNSATREA